MTVAALVLAAGRSSRMGAENKLLAEVSGRPLVLHAVTAALASRAAPVVVVTGHQGAAIATVLAGAMAEGALPPGAHRLRIVHNAGFASGIAGSLRTGLAALPADAAGALVMLGDMPLVTSTLADRLIASFEAAPGAAAVVPARRGARGNPVLLARRMFGGVSALDGDHGARKLLAGRDDVVEIEVADEGIALDLDTPEALAEFRNRQSQA